VYRSVDASAVTARARNRDLRGKQGQLFWGDAPISIMVML
jgi:hypothetical protein